MRVLFGLFLSVGLLGCEFHEVDHVPSIDLRAGTGGPPQVGCYVDETHRAVGEHFLDNQACNWCTCLNGGTVICTLIHCEPHIADVEFEPRARPGFNP